MRRLRRLLALIAAAWTLSATEGRIEEPEWPEFDPETNQFLADLMESPSFHAMLSAISTEERDKQLEYLRNSVRAGNVPEATRAEAAAQVFEDLPLIFGRHAKRYNRVAN